MEEAPRRLPGCMLGLGGGAGAVRGLRPEAEDGKGGIPDVEWLRGSPSRLPRLRDFSPDGASRGAIVCDVHSSVLVAGPRLQARGAEMLAACTPALFCTLPVAVMYCDIQVVALLLRDRRVRERLGEAS